jgi:hypothetical protein
VKAFLGVAACPIFVLSLFEIFITHKQLGYISREAPIDRGVDPNRRNEKKDKELALLAGDLQNATTTTMGSTELKTGQGASWPARIGQNYFADQQNGSGGLFVLSSFPFFVFLSCCCFVS